MRDMSSRRNYEELCIIGSGAYGTVFKAKDTENDRVVALKRVRIVNNTEEKGVPVSTLREITLLKQLDNMAHPNIVRMFDAFQTFSTTPTDSPQDLVLTIVFEHVEQDLSTFLHNSPHGLPEDVIKDLMHQLLSGIDYLHTNRMVHRDIKPQNILISKNKQVKIADFGLARVYGFCKLVTSVVVTLWYRAPEILLHAPYATMVDLWSVGTIMAEMYNRRPLFRGKSDVNQLHKILSIIGSPDQKEWPENVSLPWNSFSNYLATDLHGIIPGMCSEGIDLLNKILVFDPNKRFNARMCLLHPYFEDVDYPDSQDSGVYSQNPIHQNVVNEFKEYAKPITKYETLKTPKTGLCDKETIGIGHEIDECDIVLPCSNQEICPNENDSSRGSDSGLDILPKLEKPNDSNDIERLNASFHETSFHEDSLASDSRTLASEAITLAIESKTLTTECSRTLTRSDSGIGVSPLPICSYGDTKQYCSHDSTQLVCSNVEKTFTHDENLPRHSCSEGRDICTRSDSYNEDKIHPYILEKNLVTPEQHLSSGKTRPHDPEFDKEIVNIQPPKKRSRQDDASNG